ncbi:hypothetical protein ACTI_28510 [Actinoplanes sp. OR16]|uniref:hypothetical protein n=1 Tax=Actinoplanes sp. OR16 TaxID=946334 RepID=UPI000F6DA3B5|nr:hypothetical protein [Actinoplanes sp. OR16]BBH66166.1 hypothetical protein ACTI_28510 [Actinoplanes sp. OR16]
MSDDGSLDDLFGGGYEAPAEEAAPVEKKRRSRIPRLIGEAAVIALTTVVITAGLRAGGVSIPLLLLVSALVGLRLVVWAASAVAPPPAPKLRSKIGRTSKSSADSLRTSVKRWERNLEQAHSDPDLYARNVLPVLAELTDERLRLRHGITRDSDPRRARELLGEPLWTALDAPGRNGLRARDVDTLLDALERL